MKNTGNKSQMSRNGAGNFPDQRDSRKKEKEKNFNWKKKKKDNGASLTHPSSVLFQVTTFVFNGIGMLQLS